MGDHLSYTPRAELDRRIASLQAGLAEKDLDGALIMQNMDLFYFAGTIQQGTLFVPQAGAPLLMVRKNLERAVRESALERIVPLASPRKIPGILKANGLPLPRTLGLELDVVPAGVYLGLTEVFAGSRLADVSPLIRAIRAVKSPHEIGLMEQAARFSDQVAESVREFLEPGMTEIELAGLVEARARKLGHQGIVRMRLWGGELFYGHLLAGDSGSVPSYLSSPTGGAGVGPAIAQGPGFRPIGRHEPVLVDYVFVLGGYISDHTRVFSLGEVDDELQRAHQDMLALQAKLKTEARPGVRAGDLYRLAVETADQMGHAPHFMGAEADRIRFVGHGVGLELDEYPFLAQGQELELAEGMTIALEPKVIFPGKGVVGVENTHVVTPQGLRQLGRFQEGIVVL